MTEPKSDFSKRPEPPWRKQRRKDRIEREVPADMDLADGEQKAVFHLDCAIMHISSAHVALRRETGRPGHALRILHVIESIEAIRKDVVDQRRPWSDEARAALVEKAKREFV